MRSKETVLKQKLEIMRNQLETLEGYAQVGFQMHFKRSDWLQAITFENLSKQIENQPSTSQSRNFTPRWHCSWSWQRAIEEKVDKWRHDDVTIET